MVNQIDTKIQPTQRRGSMSCAWQAYPSIHPHCDSLSFFPIYASFHRTSHFCGSDLRDLGLLLDHPHGSPFAPQESQIKGHTQ